jgi:hypothetical protein
MKRLTALRWVGGEEQTVDPLSHHPQLVSLREGTQHASGTLEQDACRRRVRYDDKTTTKQGSDRHRNMQAQSYDGRT